MTSDAAPMPLPQRAGPRPSTTPTNPHMQLDQQPSDAAPRRRLRELLAELPVIWQESTISVPGAEALVLPADGARGPARAFMIDTEFAHLHPDPDQSLHMVLPDDIAEAAIEAGWAEQHPVARRGWIPAGAVMVYAPRSEAEADVVASLVKAAYAYASGAVGLS